MLRQKNAPLQEILILVLQWLPEKINQFFFSRCCEWDGESLPLILTDVVCHLFSGLLQSGDCRWVITEVMAKAVSICLLRALPNSASPPFPLRKGSPLLLSTPKPIAHFPEFRKTKSVMGSWIPQAWISLCAGQEEQWHAPSPPWGRGELVSLFPPAALSISYFGLSVIFQLTTPILDYGFSFARIISENTNNNDKYLPQPSALPRAPSLPTRRH